MAVAAPESLGRDARVIGLVAAGHSVSHFLQLALPPLFPLLKEEFDVPYVALGLLMTAFYGASGLGQTISGFLVDRVGARPVVLGGLALLGGAIACAGLAPAYPVLLAFALLGGFGNSVFHPADFAILNASVDRNRLGRSYSMHSLSGSAGWALGPPVVVALAAVMGWRGALMVAGSLAIVMALALAGPTRRFRDHRQARGAAGGGVAADVRLLLAAPILLAFGYFTLHATGLIGFQTFSVPAIVALYDTPLGVATGALTAFIVGYSSGTFTGGFLADRTGRHDVVAVTGMLTAAALVLAMGGAFVSAPLLAALTAAAGFCLGVTGPSRDMIVRGATPLRASGKVFGFVYSGLDLGSSLTPVLFGWLLDRGEPRLVFLAVAVLIVATITTLLQVRRRGLAAAARA